MRKTTKIRLFGERIRIVQSNGDLSIVTPHGTLEYSVSKLESENPARYISQQLAIHQTRARIANEQFEEYKHEIPSTTPQFVQVWFSWFINNIMSARYSLQNPPDYAPPQLTDLKKLRGFHILGSQTLEQACLPECSDVTSEEFSSLTYLAREMSNTYASLHESILRSLEAA